MAPEPNKSTLDVRREIRQCPTCARCFSREASFCPFDGTPLVAGAFDPLGDPLLHAVFDNRYEVLEVLGEGGMGRVYKVRHLALERIFAMKVLRNDLACDSDLAARFLNEAKATAAIKHSGIVEITDFGHTGDGSPYFVMEHLVGRTLRELIAVGGPLPAGPAVRILRQIARALGAAHEAGVVHRDLKPDNVFLIGDVLSRDVQARVVDFGAAKIIGANRITRTGIVFGTPHYMSPEQASEREVDRRADVYSLGVVMYEMFTGRVPFEADTYMGVLTQHIFVKPLPPSQVTEAAKQLGALEQITLRCLEKEPSRRFGSMDELVDALDRAVVFRDDGTAEVSPRSSSRPPRSAFPVADELEPPDPEERAVAGLPGPSARTGRAVALVAAGAAAVAIVAIGLALGASRDRDPKARVPSPPPSASAFPPASAVEPPSYPAIVAEPPPEPSAPPSSEVREPAPSAQPARRLAPRSSGGAAVRPEGGAHPAIDDVGDPFETKL